MEIIISFKDYNLNATLNNTLCARSLYNTFPYSKNVSRWGGEIYFPINIILPLESDAKSVVDVGDIAYWPGMGGVVCIFFDKTPASSGKAPEAAGLVNIIGKINSDITPLFDFNQGDSISVFSNKALE